MILSKSITVNFLIYLFVSIIFSVEYTDYEFEIFSLSIDARTNSLGGIASSKSMSLDKVYSLNKSHKRGKTLFSYGESYSGIINYFQVSRIILESEKSRVGVSLLHKQIENIHNTQDAWIDLGDNINQSDIDYSNISSYSDQQISIILLYSYHSKIGDIGVKVKPFYTSVLEFNSLGFSIDLGINRNFSDNLILGFSINNLLSVNKWSTGEVYSLYPGLSSLISYSNGKHLIISEFCISPSESKDVLLNPLYKIGYENNIYKKVKLQIGYSSIKSFSLGFSLDYKNKFFSYSFSPNFNNIILGHDHQFSILLDLPNN